MSASLLNFILTASSSSFVLGVIIVAPESDNLFTYEGNFDIIEIEAANSNDYISVIIPTETSLKAAYPNPFNPSTNIHFTLSRAESINLSIYNITGQHVETLVKGYQHAGDYELVWDASQFPSGMYLLYLTTSSDIYSQKIMLIK